MVESKNLVRPMTASTREEHSGMEVCFDYMRSDLTQNLPSGLQVINREATQAAQGRDGKYAAFKEWLLQNGAVFDDAIEYPAVFDHGLEGLAAKKTISPYEAYIFIPNTIIISVARVKACPELRQLIADNFDVFGDVHPDREQLLLATFLMFEYLKGTNSFWHPYISVMNESDLVSSWPASQISQFMDKELQMDAELYAAEIETEWSQIEPIFKSNPALFSGYTRELFDRFYNFACTRCFGWTLPSTMMVPFADFMNHLPIDNEYNVYNKESHTEKQSVNSSKTSSSMKASKRTDYSAIYKKEFAEDSLDPHC
mmetsp:Transcript_2543/g.3535  ORF Transcript_2543/g.3535 Transcript_2543/m.3535 type:complete len:313 (-) Transcript_2543:1488-2426(-)